MLPGMKHRIKIWPSNRSGQTIVLPARFGSVIKASSGTSIGHSTGIAPQLAEFLNVSVTSLAAPGRK